MSVSKFSQRASGSAFLEFTVVDVAQRRRFRRL